MSWPSSNRVLCASCPLLPDQVGVWRSPLHLPGSGSISVRPAYASSCAKLRLKHLILVGVRSAVGGTDTRWACRVCLRPSHIRAVYIFAPLANVAVHVIKSPNVGFSLADRVRPVVTGLGVPVIVPRILGQFAMVGVVAEKEAGRASSPAGIFPFCLSRQANRRARPLGHLLAELYCLRPIDHFHRVGWILPNSLGSSPLPADTVPESR